MMFIPTDVLAQMNDALKEIKENLKRTDGDENHFQL